ncbi:hypothetical protein [Flavobacterium psychrotrophum]|uniref:hypothetical protein n=1 Tax=Flavobacterium psychrotrophum TaxID=2294119 RepID=UPI000E316213|nr:hypothetical protein [Flavobacterium psychrotrophum]
MYRLIQGKATAFKPSEQVFAILHERGLSKIFNYSDYEHFKKQCKGAFNRAQAIAEMFIEYHEDTHSDYEEYVY